MPRSRRIFTTIWITLLVSALVIGLISSAFLPAGERRAGQPLNL